MSNFLLLVSQRKEDLEFAQSVAATAGLSSVKVANAKDAAVVMANESPAIVFVDTTNPVFFQEFEAAVHAKLGLFSEQVNPNRIHFISREALGAVAQLIQSPLFGHFVQRTDLSPGPSGEVYGRLVQATLNDRAFSLSRLVKEGVKIQTIKIQESTQKVNAVEAVKKFLMAAKFPTRAATLIANAVDELLMNSIFDAPVDEMGKHIYSSTPRTTVLKLDGRNQVEMNLAFDGSYVAIMACDLFGSLNKQKLLTHISKMYTNDEYKLKASVAGAGIGLANVFRSGASFLFSCAAGDRTEVTVFFKRTDNFRELKDQFQFISTQFYSESTS